MRLSAVIATGVLVSSLTACMTVPDNRPVDGSTAGTRVDGAGEPLPTDALRDTADVGVTIPDPLSTPTPSGPTEYDNLWNRIRDGFVLPAVDNPAIEHERVTYSGRKQYMQRVADRARPWLYYIVEQLEERDIPLDLALLPVVESAFRPFAYSHGRAAGLWQFIPSTGAHYGLEQGWWYDGRRDVIAATDAALTYLNRLHDMFDGDWLLAVAAYNAGEGTVMRAMKRNRRAGKPTDFWHLRLPDETLAYVPRLLAVRDLVANPGDYDLEALTPIPNEAAVTVVDIGTQMDLALAARLADISIEQLYRLNPGYNRWATTPNGPHRLVIPLNKADRFRRRLASTPVDERMRWERHRVVRGDSLIGIARQYHTEPDVIRQANNLNGNLIRAGDRLIVPIASRPKGAYVLSASQRLGPGKARSRSRQRTEYTVSRGDTLWGIARRHGLTTRQLARWNGIGRDEILRPGATLVLWTNSSGGRLAASGLRGDRLQAVRYTVRRGDSLYAIAQRFKVSINDLRQWNDLTRGKYLQPGQRLQMKVDVTRQSGI